MDPQKITELANLMRQNGDKILNSEFTLTLSGSLLRALNDSFTLIVDTDISTTQQSFQVTKPTNAKSNVFPDLQLLHDFVQKTSLLRLVYYPTEHYFEGAIDIAKFRALKRLEVQKININQVVGIQPLRAQLQHLICVKSLRSVEDIITHCGGDNSNGFVWNELKIADFSYNNLKTVDTSLEFAQYLQHLSLRHNKLHSVAAIKWLRHLKTLDLSYNCLTVIPQFHVEACKRLQVLNINNNFIEELLDVAKLESLTDLDLSDNCLLEHQQLLPLSALLTLRMLNLNGNPLHCNPKHRMATAQYLHKNSATVKFLLDFEPLSKAEKAITGSQKLRYINSINRSLRSSATSIGILSSSPSNTPISSYDSRRSIKTHDSSSEPEQVTATLTDSQNTKRLRKKIRTVDIEEQDDADPEIARPSESSATQIQTTHPFSSIIIKEPVATEHLEAKKQMEELRQKYGSEWLNTENEQQRFTSRQIFNDYLGDFSAGNAFSIEEPLNISSTPTSNSPLIATFDQTLTPIKVSCNNSTTVVSDNQEHSTAYFSFESNAEPQPASPEHTKINQETNDQSAEEEQPNDPYNIYSRNNHDEDKESPVSDTEPDEETYIVNGADKPSEPLFFTISSNFMREKDAQTQHTNTKWSLTILESCERIKSNTLRINFDTVKKDKKERIYNVENTLCKELEEKLRNILSNRNLNEMNIIIYRCINCSSQFTREDKQTLYKAVLRCPDCHSTFVAELHDVPSSPSDSTKIEPKLSPASIVEESPLSAALLAQQSKDNNSIGSANSLNESSSCSKISHSQCSFDSNQSVVGSSNTERDLEFRANESDVDIISNPSQSSIEVLDAGCGQTASRKTSEERRISQIPNLHTIEDDINNTQSFIEREFFHLHTEQNTMPLYAAVPLQATIPIAPNADSAPVKSLAHLQLTESSSSGSITDSICTTYEHQATKANAKRYPQPAADLTTHPSMILSETASINSKTNNNTNESQETNIKTTAKDDAGLFGALFQSTNLLLSSSKKLIEAEAISQLSTLSQPYKFNYEDYGDIDHRFKLYFHHSKFKKADEQLKWLVCGRVYNPLAQSHYDGLIALSTYKCYLMETYAPPNDDVSKWVRQVTSVPVDHLIRIQLLPWKVGVSFTLKDWGNFLVLQDIQRTENLMMYFQKISLPPQCELVHQPDAVIRQRTDNAVHPELLKICVLLCGCEWTCAEDKRVYSMCTLLTTDVHLYLSAGNYDWLSTGQQPDIKPCLTQPLSNLVDVERITQTEYNINFLDETQNKCELWKLQFATKAGADCCLNAIGQSWEQLFGVSLLSG